MLFTYETREEWLAARLQSIGSSDAACLWRCGYASQSLYSLYCDKAFGQSWQPSKSELRRLKKGQLLEPYIRDIAAEELGVELRTDPPHSLRRSGLLSASLDAWYGDITNFATETDIIPVELKFVGDHNAHEWADGNLPLKYECQVLHQMIVIDAPYGYVCGLCDDELFVRRVERQPEIEAEHLRRCAEFWRHVETKTPPEIDGSEATTDAIKSRWRREKGPRVEVGDWLDESAVNLEGLKAAAKETKEQIDAIENRIRDAIGDAEGCMSPSGVEFTWKTQERKEYVVAASSSRVLRRSKGRKGAR